MPLSEENENTFEFDKTEGPIKNVAIAEVRRTLKKLEMIRLLDHLELTVSCVPRLHSIDQRIGKCFNNSNMKEKGYATECGNY